jgi:putative ABC transport system permease protein
VFRRIFRKPLREQEIDEEFEAHLALESKLLQERGLSREEADLGARCSFGNRSRLAEEARETWIWAWFDRLSQDLRYAIRTLLRSPAFSLAAVLSIALGIGAATAVYGIADTVFLRRLPYTNPDRLMWVAIRFPRMRTEFLASPDYVLWRRENDVFQNLAATQAHGGQTMLLNGENAVEVRDVRVSANFLRTFGIHPAIGRDFEDVEELPDHPKAVLLTDRFWREHFHADAHLVGKSIEMDGQPYVVAGILPRGFQFPMDIKVDVLTTLPVSPAASWHDRSVSTWAVYGRLKPGVGMAQARAELHVLLARSEAEIPKTFRSGAEPVLEPLQQHRVGNARLLLSVLIGAVTCLLLIACANVSNLLLARWSARSGEFAIRAAIGAGRIRLARQLLTEAALLTLAGCALGMLLAFGLLRAFVHYGGNELPRMNDVKFDSRLFVIGLVVALFTTVIFGALPSLQAGRLDIQRALQRCERAGLAAGSYLLKRLLVTGEMALCLILLSGAALLLQTLWHLRNDRLGFQPENVLSISIPLKGTKLETGNREALVGELLEFIRHVPGVEAAAQTECTPLSGGPMDLTFSRSDRPVPEPFHVGDGIHVCGAGSEYAAAAGIRVLRGRFFAERDFGHPNTLAIINETAARRFFPGENPIGKQIMGMRSAPNSPVQHWKTVVGVVSDSKNRGLDAPPEPQVFFNGLAYPAATSLQLLVRSIGDRHALESVISGKLRSIDSGLIAEFEPVSQAIAEMSGGARFNAILVGSFAAVALLMAVIGVYGVLAFAVSQRTQEIGIRIALGGERGCIFRLVLRQGIGPVLIGIASGLTISLALARYLKAVLYGVSPTDPTTLVLTALALTATAVLAISIPARRASRVDPMVALRHQ